MKDLFKHSLYYAVCIGDYVAGAFFDRTDALAFAIVIAERHPAPWYIIDTGTGEKWRVNIDAINLR